MAAIPTSSNSTMERRRQSSSRLLWVSFSTARVAPARPGAPAGATRSSAVQDACALAVVAVGVGIASCLPQELDEYVFQTRLDRLDRDERQVPRAELLEQ